MAYGPSLSDAYRRTAIYLDKILKGVKPEALPMEQPTKLELTINQEVRALKERPGQRWPKRLRCLEIPHSASARLRLRSVCFRAGCSSLGSLLLSGAGLSTPYSLQQICEGAINF